MGSWIRRGRIYFFLGCAPIFRPGVPKPFKISSSGPQNALLKRPNLLKGPGPEFRRFERHVRELSRLCRDSATYDRLEGHSTPCARTSTENGVVLKERKRRRADKRSSKTRKWTAQFSPLIPRFSCVLRANFKGAEKQTDSPKEPFWTTVSPARRLLRSFGAF